MNCQICHRPARHVELNVAGGFTDYRITLFVILDSFLFVTGISFLPIHSAASRNGRCLMPARRNAV
ncbi:MAG: hypothetical protein KJ666_14225 [Bacteroidetes bacterium]|nr:hypothetical protein [Bacteroidota bacterium]MBU2586365.1 hypothetical protein [Bacteroidota bacterium]